MTCFKLLFLHSKGKSEDIKKSYRFDICKLGNIPHSRLVNNNSNWQNNKNGNNWRNNRNKSTWKNNNNSTNDNSSYKKPNSTNNNSNNSNKSSHHANRHRNRRSSRRIPNPGLTIMKQHQIEHNIQERNRLDHRGGECKKCNERFGKHTNDCPYNRNRNRNNNRLYAIHSVDIEQPDPQDHFPTKKNIPICDICLDRHSGKCDMKQLTAEVAVIHFFFFKTINNRLITINNP